MDTVTRITRRSSWISSQRRLIVGRAISFLIRDIVSALDRYSEADWAFMSIWCLAVMRLSKAFALSAAL